MQRPSTTKLYNRILGNAIKFIDRNMASPVLQLDDFCTVVGYSRRTAQRALAHEGTAWSELVTTRRMIEAGRQLVRFKTKKIATIASAVGYDNEEAFTRAFIGHHGTTPAKYRELHAERT